MGEIIYHVFFEDHQEGLGLYIGSYKEKERADKIGNYVWDLFDNTGIDKTDEIIEAVKLWRKYKIFRDTEYARINVCGTQTTTGLSSLLVIDSIDIDFVEKYIVFRGTTQPEIFEKQPFEDCVMYQHKEKRLLAKKKAARKGRDIHGSRNLIIINGVSTNIEKERYGISVLDRLLWQKIEVTQDFFDRMEKNDFVSINILADEIKSEIIDFENYFKFDATLKARFYDELENVLYFDLLKMAIEEDE